ncbi:MAG TPA: CBS domain-containing protein [Myxococcales bacterium]|nr:CBS domain-containing protein [Myxococcales bacterium]
MKLSDVMKKDVATCRKTDSLGRAAGLMWDAAIGCVPVLDESGRPIAMLTDRDICMAVYLTGKMPWQLSVESAMSKTVACVRRDRTLEQAAMLMREHRVHRLPVVDPEGRLCGLVSLSDLATATVEVGAGRDNADTVARTLRAVSSRPQAPLDGATAPESSA